MNTASQDRPTGSILDQASTAIDALEAGKRVDTADSFPLFAPEVQGFLSNEFAYDPAQS